MRLTVLATLALTLLSCPAIAVDLSKEQLEPWSALERQVALYLKRDWDEHQKYIHPKLVDWGDTIPAPVHFSDNAKQYFEAFEAASDKTVAHLMVPVTVVVVDDVAIINAYVHVLTKPEDKPVEKIYQLHNTWKKHEGRWKLLATCNSIASPSEDSD